MSVVRTSPPAFVSSQPRLGPHLLLAFCLFLAACANPHRGVDEENFSSPAAGMLSIAKQMKGRKDLVGALDFYQRAAQRDPKNITAHKEAAAILAQFGDMKAAAEHLRQALQTNPEDASLQREYGKILLALEQFTEAQAAFEAALTINSQDIKARNGLGIILDYQGDHAAAQRQYEAALQEDPTDLSSLNNLAYSYILAGNYNEAIKQLEPALNNEKATPALRQNLALAYGLAGMALDAERVAKIDLPPAKVKENLEYYKRKRAEKTIAAPYAELGEFATKEMAQMQIERVKPQLDASNMELQAVVATQIATPGSTPRFVARVLGFTKPEQATVLCNLITQNGASCVMHEK